ncbi:hypothetical protein FRC09_006725 [Ceratobasidium sp. 395]|nr:hypothetical protein FRC09_006725 [Ceratobasidium sp. 395]
MRRPIEQSMVKEVLLAVESELESLASEEKTLHDMRISLAMTRNNTPTVARVNTLPPEILARIFGLSRTEFYHRPDTKDNFCRVCVYWRQTAMDAADLWTHVYVNRESPRRLTKSLLSRSKGVPIHVHAYEPDEYASDGYSPALATKEIMGMLEADLHRVSTLEIESDNERDGFFYSLLERWSNHVDINFPTSLFVRGPEMHGSRPIRRLGGPSNNIEKMLLALTTLHLNYSRFEWDSNAYRGLVDLRLNVEMGVSIPLPDLANILAACPGLAILKLQVGIVGVVRIKGRTQPAPIKMKHLKVLNLYLMDANATALVLSLITLPGPGVELGISLAPYRALDSQLVSFFARSKVTTLVCESDRYITSTYWKRFLRCIGGPRILILCGTRSLQLEKCKVPPGQDLQDIRASLEKLYPDLQVTLSNTDSTLQYSCRLMDDS